VLVVPQHEVPFVTVNVVVPGGSTGDPEGGEGAAAFVAELIDRGTALRDGATIGRRLDRLGIALATEVSEEWTTIGLSTTTPALTEGLEILAELLTKPTFPQAEVEQARERALTGLQVQATRPADVADRAFRVALYGAHPYGRLPSPASVADLSREDLVEYHETWYRPDGALIVVSGDVDSAVVEERLERIFAGWLPRARPEIDFPRAPDRVRREILVVHQPGSVQAEIRVGHLLQGGDVADWDALVMANEVLGGGPPGRLQQVLRDALGFTYDARSTVQRGRRLGRFEVVTAVRTDVAAAAVEEILVQLDRVRTTALPSSELADRVGYLVGSLPRSLETPQQVAGEITSHRLLGLPAERLESARSRWMGLDTATVREAAELRLRPEQLLIVVAGDAAALQPRLRGLGEVAVVDVHGAPLTLAELVPGPPSETFDLRGLEPTVLRYSVVAGGMSRGEAVRTLDPVEGGWRFASRIEAGPQRLEQEVVVDTGLGFRSSESLLESPTGRVRVHAELRGGRLLGEVEAGVASRPVDLAAPPGVTLSDGLELALWAAPLSVGREIRLPVADLQAGAVTEVLMRVEEETEITVPAGTFPVFRVSVTGRDPQNFYVRKEAPHVPVRMESVTRPVALELVDAGGR
jgi:zinc protease